MNEINLAGCSSTPLGSYLTALGLLRAVTRLLDPEATGRWERRHFVIGTVVAGAVDELVDELVARFEPLPIVSPWNAGSGFAGNGKNVSAERSLRAVRESDDARLGPLRQAVLVGDLVVEKGRYLGWGGKGDDLWDRKRKAEVLALCRAEFPDAALPWLDAAVALGQDADPTYSRLLGTGGNFGRQDLSATYLDRARTALGDRRSSTWLRAALTGDESVPYLRDAVGQFDPGRAGGIQSSPWEKADDKGFVNPWAFLLTVEATLLFATAVVRRHGAGYSRAALPFQVRGSTAGYDSAAEGESPLGELWTPEWSRPARIDELEHLFGEGRAEWGGSPARTGLDFARAAATLGVDRGLTAFERHIFVDRHGQNPLALSGGRVEIVERAGVGLLAGLDGWLNRLRRDRVPASLAPRLRALDAALFEQARTGGPAAMVEVFAALGRAHDAVGRSSEARSWAGPLVLRHGRALLEALLPATRDDVDLRIALALATARDHGLGSSGTPLEGTLRHLLTPVRPERAGRTDWTDRPERVGLGAGLLAAVGEAARRRAFPGATNEIRTDLLPAVRGARIGCTAGVQIGAGDVEAIVDGGFDAERCAALLSGLLCSEWPVVLAPGTTPRSSGSTGSATSVTLDVLSALDPGAPDPAVDLLVPFTGTAHLRVQQADGDRKSILLRPGSEWPVLLGIGRVSRVLSDAAHRLRLAGLRWVVTPPTADANDPRGPALAALLLLPIDQRTRMRALERVAALPRGDLATTASEETPE